MNVSHTATFFDLLCLRFVPLIQLVPVGDTRCLHLRSGFAKLSLIGGLLSLSAFAVAGYLGDRYGRKKLGVLGIIAKTAVVAWWHVYLAVWQFPKVETAPLHIAPGPTGCGFLQRGCWCRVCP